MDPNIGGLQMAVFELIWPTYPWVSCIRLLDHPQNPVLYIQSMSPQNSTEKEACLTSLREALQLWRPGCAPILHLLLESEDCGASIEIMSMTIFRSIAAEVAPWRLEWGR